MATQLIIFPWLFRTHLLTSLFQWDSIYIISVLMFILIVMTDSRRSMRHINSVEDHTRDDHNEKEYYEGLQNKIYRQE